METIDKFNRFLSELKQGQISKLSIRFDRNNTSKIEINMELVELE